MDPFSVEQRRSFMALLCRVAWADGVVTPEEREAVSAVAQRLGGAGVSKHVITEWLDHGPPAAELQSLPESLGQLFYYEAFKLAEADGDLATEEVELLESIVMRVFAGHEEGTPLARIALATRKRD